MRSPVSFFHFFRLLPLTVFAQWQIFLPVVVIPVVVFIGMHWYLESDGKFHELESLGYVINLTGFIPLWIVSSCVTRIGNPKEVLLLRVIPMEGWKRTTLVILEHFLLTFTWIMIPFGLVVFFAQPEGFPWIWFFLIPIIGSASFFIAACAWTFFASQITNRVEDLALSHFACGVGGIMLFTIVFPNVNSGITGITFFYIVTFILVLSIVSLFVSTTIHHPQRKSRFDMIDSEEENISLFSIEMVDPIQPGKIQYKKYLQMTSSILMNCIFLGIALFFSHSLMDFWIHGYDNYVYYQLGQDSHLFDMIDYAVWSTFVLLTMISLVYFGIRIMTRGGAIGYVILDCRTRPLSGWLIVSWAVLSVIVFALGIRIIYSGLVLEIDLRLPALMSLCLFFSSAGVFWFASLPSIAMGKGFGDTTDYLGLGEIMVLIGSGLSMLYVLMINALSIEDVPIDILTFAGLFVYNIWAMHWMWKRY